jgi:hypothetical protein
LIWVARHPDSESQIAARWLVSRFVDQQAEFTPPDGFSPAKRRNGTAGASHDSSVSDYAELASFNDLVKQYGLASDPALLFLPDLLNSPHLKSAVDSPASYGSDPDPTRQQQTFVLLDALYEWLREQVQNDLDRP